METFAKSSLLYIAALFLALVAAQNVPAAPWVNTVGLNLARNSHTATLLPNGQVLVAGGFGTSTLATAQLYDFSSDSWLPAGVMNFPRLVHTSTLLPNGKVLMAGGFGSTSNLVSAELFDPASTNWSSV